MIMMEILKVMNFLFLEQIGKQVQTHLILLKLDHLAMEQLIELNQYL